MKINLIVALDNKNGYAKNGLIPWIGEDFAKEDLKNFRRITMGHTCIMGRKTYEDTARFTGKKDILPGRDCIVLSQKPGYFISNETLVFSDMKSALDNVDLRKAVFIIGGGSLFKEALKWDIESIYLTRINNDYGCDQHFPFDKMLESYWSPNEWRSKEFPDLFYYKYIKRDKV